MERINQEVSPVALAELYRQRAAVLAIPPAEFSSHLEQEKAVLFRLGDETYALPIEAVKRVFAEPILTPAPGVAGRWAGVFAVQGEIVPILHLARILDMPESTANSGEYVLTLRTLGKKVGLLVGRVLEIREIPAKTLRPAGNQTRCLKGVGADNTLLLDIDLLMEQEFSQ